MLSGRADYMDGGMPGAMDMGMSGVMMNGRGAYRPPDRGRGICRDYHSTLPFFPCTRFLTFILCVDNGYCARGAFCKYSHGEDAVVPGQLFPMNAMSGAAYSSMMGASDMAFPMAGTSNAPYNPHERIDMRPLAGNNVGMSPGRPPHGRAPILPRQGDMNGAMARNPGELPVIQDLTPRVPEEEGGQVHDIPMNGSIPAANGFPAPGLDLALPMNPMASMRVGLRPPRNGPIAQKGTFGDAPSFRPERRNDKTLVVEKIPEDKLSLGSINDWFKRFGTVTNVAVDASGAKALVSFSTHEEAHAAWKSEDAVFGNRFVKVFWHRPMGGHGQIGARMLAASANLVAKVAAKDNTPPSKPAAPASSSSTPAPTRKATPSSSVSALAAKQQLLEKQIAEQKSLMEQLSTASPEGKKEIMARLRKLNEEMKPTSTSTPSAVSPAQPSSTKGSRSSTPRTDDQAQKERERLDKELELHSAATAVEGESEENTEELKARLEKLRAEVCWRVYISPSANAHRTPQAASLGISSDGAETTPTYNTGSFRPYRGRGRGARSYYRGAMRGGPPRTSMKLDNRPKKLVVKGVKQEQLQSVRDWYEVCI